MMKVDMGPGRFDVNFCVISQSYVFYFFAGLPNDTELDQEMDQLFTYAKTAMEVNWQELWKARYKCLRQKAKTHTWDLPWIVFGEKIKLANGTVLALQNVFNMAFTPLGLQRAGDKCSYAPATRELLNSEVLLLEVSNETTGIKDNSNDQGNLTTHQQMLRDIEHQNYYAVEELIGQGFKQANQFKLKSIRKSKEIEPSKEDITIPHTRDHKEKLISLIISSFRQKY